jgi:hypothetical protein
MYDDPSRFSVTVGGNWTAKLTEKLKGHPIQGGNRVQSKGPENAMA